MIKKLDAIRGLKPMTKGERSKFNITDVCVGGYFSFRKQNWLVLEVNKYEEVKWKDFSRNKKGDRVYELTIFSLKTGEVKYIEYLVDDGSEIYFTEQEVKMIDLGVTRAMLEEIAEDGEGEIIFEGRKYYYSDDETTALLYYRGDTADGIPVRCYEFESTDYKYLTVEAWYTDTEDDRPSREAYISVDVKEADIEVLQLK